MRAALLALDLFGLDDLRVGKPHATEDEGEARLELADEGLPAGAGTVLERVAVDRDVVRHGLAVGADEEVPRESARRLVNVGAAQSRVDARHAVIGIEALANPQHRTGQ